MIIDRFVQVNLRDGTTSKEESEANSFAAALLMPRSIVVSQLGELLANSQEASREEVVSTLAGRFEVSREAMEFRLASLGVVAPR